MSVVRRTSLIAVLIASLNACSVTPERCDMQRPMGSCSVRIELQPGKVMVCPGEQPAGQPPVCMSALIDMTNARGYAPVELMLLPGQCVSLGSEVTSASKSACKAFAARTD